MPFAHSLSLSCPQRTPERQRGHSSPKPQIAYRCVLSMHKTVNFFYIVRVEEQNKGLDNPSNPPCWCRSKCISRTNADRHPFQHCKVGDGAGDGGEDRLLAHDLRSDWSTCGAPTRCRGGDGRDRGCHFHRKPSCQRHHQARHQAGESLNQAVSQSERRTRRVTQSSPHHDPHTHTPGPVPSDPLFALCEFRVDC